MIAWDEGCLAYVWWIRNAWRWVVIRDQQFIPPHGHWRLVDIAKPKRKA